MINKHLILKSNLYYGTDHSLKTKYNLEGKERVESLIINQRKYNP